jgi:hypothetical protein
MKQHLLTFLFCFGLSITGCQKSDSDPQPTPVTTPTIVGRWNVTSIHTVETEPLGKIVSDQTTAIPAGTMPVEFTATEYIVKPGMTGSQTLRYDVQYNTVRLTSGENYIIQELTANKLVLVSTGNLTRRPNILDITITYER